MNSNIEFNCNRFVCPLGCPNDNFKKIIIIIIIKNVSRYLAVIVETEFVIIFFFSLKSKDRGVEFVRNSLFMLNYFWQHVRKKESTIKELINMEPKTLFNLAIC